MTPLELYIATCYTIGFCAAIGYFARQKAVHGRIDPVELVIVGALCSMAPLFAPHVSAIVCISLVADKIAPLVRKIQEHRRRNERGD
jgi:hypothetical protein